MAEEAEVVEVEEQPSEAQTEDEQVEQQEEATNSDNAEDTGEPPPKKDKGVGKRINELTRARYEAERQAEYWRQQAMSVSQKPQETRSDAPPSIDQFQTFEDYNRAVVRYEAAQLLKTQREQEREEQARYQERTKAEKDRATWLEREDKARDDLVDYDETITDVLQNPRIANHPGIGEALIASDIGPQILYYLGQNPKEADRIADMSPPAAAKAIGRIEAQLELKSKPVSSAPPPPKPVKTTPKKMDGLHDDLPIDEWMKRARAERRR